jgi:hypothetical protein
LLRTWYRKLWLRSTAMHRAVQKFKGQYFLQAVEGKWVTARDSRRNICSTVTFLANGYCTEAQSESVLLTKSTCSHARFWFCHFAGQIWKHLWVPAFYLHLQGHASGTTKTVQIYPIIRHLNSKFQTLYLPQQDISVDESLTLWKGRLSFEQYLPLKWSQFEIKTFELCESHSY